MTKVLVEDSNLTSIANAIREKNGQTTQYKPSEMGKAIEEIELGLFPTETIKITENGSYNVMNYANANVNVPSKILQPKTITENGVYNAIDDGVDGYDVVTVNTGKYKPRYIKFRGFTGTELDYELNNIDTSSIQDMSNMFDSCRNLISIPQLDTSGCTNLGNAFLECIKLQSIPQLNTSKVSLMPYIFRNCQKLQSIPQLDTSNVTNFVDSCLLCTSLTNVGGFKDLGKSFSTAYGANNSSYTVNLSHSSLLTHESAMNVINNLYDIATKGCKTQQVRFHANVMALLSEEEIAIATNKGWSVTA